jgi:DNA-binding transcriptional MocR family regulator
MRHATVSALDGLEDLLSEIRKRHTTLRERKRGAFYRGGQGWLHFHEDPAGLFADLKIGGNFARLRVNTKAEQGALLRQLRDSLADE